MKPSEIIRDAVTHVTLLRESVAGKPGLASAVSAIKHFQARRFSGTYFDFLHSEQYKNPAVFFLQELYSEKDYSERDSQFARIAGALERLFPQDVVQTAVSLAQLHRLTEDLDLAMARSWMGNADKSDVARYLKAWRSVGRRSDRDIQLETVLSVGRELDRLTRTRGLRMMLKMMRGPANLAGMASLQQFLESGFDTFAEMGRHGDGAGFFLATVMDRESALIDRLFDSSADACETEMTLLLGQSP
ncbi:MAG: FFLEELY motif protein [Rhodoferax sp.]